MQNATGLTITNPLVLYRALIATNRIGPDPAQLRLALQLSKLYDALKDYEPTAQYSQRLQSLGRALGPSNQSKWKAKPLGSPGIWQSVIREKEKRDSLAVTRVLSDHEEALKLNSPKGLMVHGEVGTGKSMLIDLFADCLPTRKKKRWHFNTFMLDIYAKLEQLRRSRLAQGSSGQVLDSQDHSMLWLARDLIETSPILFLDEFQLPDRTSAKIMTNLMTGFFGLGGVLVATSNRMPDELAKAAGIELFQPSATTKRFGWGLSSTTRPVGNSKVFDSLGEYAQFLELLKTRCEVWEMEGKSDYRRSTEGNRKSEEDATGAPVAMTSGLSKTTATNEVDEEQIAPTMPSKFFLQTNLGPSSLPPELEAETLNAIPLPFSSPADVPWETITVRVYGRNVTVPRSFNKVASYTFNEICGSNLGPADYVTLASNFHTFIIVDIPVLTSSLKNEARRFITLLDALYEAKCKLLVSAQADPDNLFFPELRPSKSGADGQEGTTGDNSEGVYAETFSDIHQDLTAPFRPNISTYSETSVDETHSRLQGLLADDALEDTPPNRVKRMLGKTDSDFEEDEKYAVKRAPSFGQAGLFLGEDEKFAYKRATSRLWEMCGKKWWDRNEDGWWRPLPVEARGWERSSEVMAAEMTAQVVSKIQNEATESSVEGMGGGRDVTEKEDEVMFKYGASPFRTSEDAPPKIGWTHVWGMMTWGKKSGAWGKGVEGLKDRKKEEEDT